MICPNCGCEIVDDHLYCDKCGMEIQIVPVFEPEIENSIIETLSTVAEEIEGKGTADDNVQVHESETKPQTVDRKNTRKKYLRSSLLDDANKNWLLVSLFTFIAVLLIASFAALFMYHRYSVSYQVEQAKKYAQQENYTEAISYLEKAREIDGNSSDIVMLESSYYYLMGETQKSVDVLLAMVQKEQLEYDVKEKAYERIISIYDEEARYEDINVVLTNCGDAQIQTHFQQYMALEPEFSYASGTYDSVVPLKMSSNTTGKIYYTLDGSDPHEHSLIYTAPLFLESGEYQIAAMFVNDYGIKSKIVRSWFIINLVVPDPPEVLLYSGDYHVPTMIEVNAPEGETVYYTTDSSDPTADSLVYTGPIQMPLGRSNYKFAVISEEGVSSEVISRSFDFNLNTDISTDKAVKNVMQALLDRDVLTDLQGHSHGIKGKYVFKYNSIVEISDLGYYYLLNEYIEDTSGNQVKTEHLYAVEVYGGAPNRLVYDENGQMGLIPLQ